MPAARLSRSILDDRMPLRVPDYDMARLRPGIVHLGLGNFHRAHMARYTHALFGIDPGATEWGIIGVGLRSTDRALHDALAPQDWLYSLVERDGKQERSEIIGSLCGMILVDGDSTTLLRAMDDAAIRIVSLTVTERGYCLTPGTKALDRCHPAIVTDLGMPARPLSAIGIIVASLQRRMAAGTPAFTVMSCDNIQQNGNILRGAVLDYAQELDPSLASWIATNARFPNTTVDRITPAAQPQDIALLAERTGIADAAPVFCEPFTQWVVEDDFADRRPAWERVGAQFVADVAPYEKMKLRLLNASHLALACFGEPLGYRHVDEAMRDPALKGFVAELMDRETGPTLDPVPGIDITAYKASIISRFANPAIGDTLARILDDAPLAYVLDPIVDRLRQGESISMLALVVAAWLRRNAGDTADDPHLFGDLAAREDFRAPVQAWLDCIGQASPDTLRICMAEAAAAAPTQPASLS